MRKLATIRQIKNISPIDGADNICVAEVSGWKVVIKKGEYKQGEWVVFCEIDSWIPTELAPFLSKNKTPSVFNGVSGEKLRSIKLKGQISQGLILPISILGDIHKIEDKYFIESAKLARLNSNNADISNLQ